jgi:hypothetical protein
MRAMVPVRGRWRLGEKALLGGGGRLTAPWAFWPRGPFRAGWALRADGAGARLFAPLLQWGTERLRAVLFEPGHAER